MDSPSTTAARKRPLITANRVTLARLALLPIGTWLLYQGTTGQHIALYFMTIVGCTDFVDGYLARRHGATVLGGLMDPIADKVFIAAVFLPMIELGWLPMPLILAIFLREFVITAARTTYSRRNVALKTTYLAKVKTWYQMITCGLIFILRISPGALKWVGLAGALGPGLLGLIVAYAITRKVWKGGVVFLFSFAVLGACAALFKPEHMILGLAWTTVAITWASGGVYLFGLRYLKGRGLDIDDLVRLFGAVTLPVLACVLIDRHQVTTWPIVLAVTAVSVGIAFYRSRDVYLGKRADAKLAPEPAEPAASAAPRAG